jgi:hypothetical protein
MLIEKLRLMRLPVGGFNMPEVFGEVSVGGMRLNRDESEDAINVPKVFDAIPNDKG